jgi:hypothetical protein
MQRCHLTVATLHFSFQKEYMALKLRASRNYIGTYYAPTLNRWRALHGKNTKTIIGDFPTEIEAARAYNAYVVSRDGWNAGFLLSRVNVLPEEQVCAPAGGADAERGRRLYEGLRRCSAC